MTICCRYDVHQSNITYSDIKQSVSRDRTINKKPVQPSELEYEAIQTGAKTIDYDVKMDTNPAYQCDVKMDTNPAYQATS